METGLKRDRDSLNLPDAILQHTATVRGTIRFPSDTLYAADIYAYIPGLWKRGLARTRDKYAFRLDDIPAGAYTLVLQPAYPMTLSQWKILALPITLAPGQTLDLDTVSLPLRAGMQDPAYTRDSATAWAFHLASLDTNQTPDSNWVPSHTAVSGNRIVMLYDFARSVFRIPPRSEGPRRPGSHLRDGLERLRRQTLHRRPRSLRHGPSQAPLAAA